MYPIQSEHHPLLAPVVARLRSLGLVVESTREIMHVWGRAERGAVGACNFAYPCSGYPRADVAQCWVTLVLGMDAERSRTGLSSRDAEGGLVWQTDSTYRQIAVIVTAPAGWTIARLREALSSVGIG